jgi:hypothetical protein
MRLMIALRQLSFMQVVYISFAVMQTCRMAFQTWDAASGGQTRQPYCK